MIEYSMRKDALNQAREALYTSFSSIPPLTTSSSSSILLNTPQTQFHEFGRAQTAPETTTWSCEPIVRPGELQQHQGQIENLRWNSLTLKPRNNSITKSINMTHYLFIYAKRIIIAF